MIQTLTRAGNFEGDLEIAVKRFSLDCVQLIDPLNISTKYGLYDEREEPYLLIISKSKYGKHSVYGYNTILTVTSESVEKNREVARSFEEKTGIRLKEAPEQLSRIMQGISLSFQICRKYGKIAMEVLRK